MRLVECLLLGFSCHLLEKGDSRQMAASEHSKQHISILRHWRVFIGMSGRLSIGTGGGFEIGITGGFHWNTQQWYAMHTLRD